MVHASAASAKTALRAQMKAVRAKAAKDNPGAADQAINHLPLSFVGRFGTVAGYFPLGSEIDPRPLMAHLAKAGARLALPRALAGAPLQFHVWRPGDDLEKSGFGVAEPLASAAPCQPDLVIVPLLAFDRLGGRMGYGQGHYDRTLSALRAHGDVVALGLGFDAQSVATLPIEDHDETLDGILTQMRYIPVQRKI
jgi:5-formyltetrahydrofolate cyclo-ligase